MKILKKNTCLFNKSVTVTKNKLFVKHMLIKQYIKTGVNMSENQKIKVTAVCNQIYGDVILIEMKGYPSLYISKEIIENEIKKFNNFKK